MMVTDCWVGHKKPAAVLGGVIGGWNSTVWIRPVVPDEPSTVIPTCWVSVVAEAIIPKPFVEHPIVAPAANVDPAM